MSSDGGTIRFDRPPEEVQLSKQHRSGQEQSDREEDRTEYAELDRRAQELDARQARLEAREAEIEKKEQQVEQKLRRLRELLESAGRQEADMLDENEETIVSFTLSVARKVLQHEIDNGHYKIGQIVRAALDRVRTEGQAVVRVNPGDRKLAEKALEGRGAGEDGCEISVVADPDVAPAACCIETDYGKVVSDVGARLERVEKTLVKRA